VFVETTAELSIRTAARLSLVSPAQTSRSLSELAVLGILERNEVPPSTVHRLLRQCQSCPEAFWCSDRWQGVTPPPVAMSMWSWSVPAEMPAWRTDPKALRTGAR
jgi:hypothetical protein